MYPLQSWIPHAIQTFVHAENVCLAHLQYEYALLFHPHLTSGRAYTVTDPGKPYTVGDIYFLLSTLSKSGFEWQHVPAVPLLLVAYLIEWYGVLRYVLPALAKTLPEIPHPINQLQPSIFQISGPHQVAINDQAMLSPSQGGIGYRPACDSMEGMCQQVKNWNDELDEAEVLSDEQKPVVGAVDALSREVNGVATAAGSAATK